MQRLIWAADTDERVDIDNFRDRVHCYVTKIEETMQITPEQEPTFAVVLPFCRVAIKMRGFESSNVCRTTESAYGTVLLYEASPKISLPNAHSYGCGLVAACYLFNFCLKCLEIETHRLLRYRLFECLPLQGTEAMLRFWGHAKGAKGRRRQHRIQLDPVRRMIRRIGRNGLHFG